MANNSIHLFEVGPRDGLQNEPKAVSLKNKLEFVSGLLGAGIRDIELGAFVRPDRVPQMADTDRIYREIRTGKLKLRSARVWSLVPNRKGLERALAAGATNLAVFTAATESFARKNIGMSIKESIEEFSAVIAEAKKASAGKIKFRGYVSTAFGCPFEGRVAPKSALRVIEHLAKIGVSEISVGDTIGVATPASVLQLMKPALKEFGSKMIAGHFHDTRGTALANALTAIQLGVRTLDSSAGGLGGCPFAPGATGNLATEDLIYMLDGMGIKTGIDLEKLCKVSLRLAAAMRRPLSSRYLQAFAKQCSA